MKTVNTLLAMVVLSLVAANLFAEEKKSDGKHKHGPQVRERGDMLKGVNLTDEQKAKVEALKKEYEPKMKDSWKKAGDILTADQRKAREEAVKAAKAAGKKGTEIREAARAAVKLTDDQKAKVKAGREAAAAVRKELHSKILGVLTVEQREKLKKGHKSHKGHKGCDKDKVKKSHKSHKDCDKAKVKEGHKSHKDCDKKK